MDHPPIVVLSGTNRPGSNTLKVARSVERHYRAIAAPVELYTLESLPPEVFSPQAYAVKPPSLEAVQQRILSCAGLHVVTPEYNGSFPGVLKYFIDLLKYPESLQHKPAAFVGLARGMWGGLRAVEQLQLIFGYRNAHIFPDRVFIAGADGKFGADGLLNDAELNDRLARQADGFARFACVLAAPQPTQSTLHSR